MASLALDPAYRRVEVDEFLQMDFGGARAELVDGIIFMMAGGSEVHSRVAVNLVVALQTRLRGTGCRPYNSDFAARTQERTVRFPDVSVYCNDPAAPGNEGKQLLGDPQVVFEVLSPSTASLDQKDKLEEYRNLAGVREIVIVDPAVERVRRAVRDDEGMWHDGWLPAGADLQIPSLDLTIPHAEIFARD
jgi:Uma2 family endonuclease